MTGPDVPDTAYFRSLVRLTPKQFGYLGAYSTEMLDVERVPGRFSREMVLRFTTSILAGKTVTETQRAVVKVPASWWQHAKQAAGAWHTAWLTREHKAWRLFALPLDIILLPLLHLLSWFLRRHPVRYAELIAEVRFSRDTLYPGADVLLPPDRFGAPVMYETLEISPAAPDGAPWRLEEYGPERFLDRREVASEVLRDPGLDGDWAISLGGPASAVFGTLEWLARHGVDADHLVPRGSL